MKISKKQLQNIINEELKSMFSEEIDYELVILLGNALKHDQGIPGEEYP